MSKREPVAEPEYGNNRRMSWRLAVVLFFVILVGYVLSIGPVWSALIVVRDVDMISNSTANGITSAVPLRFISN